MSWLANNIGLSERARRRGTESYFSRRLGLSDGGRQSCYANTRPANACIFLNYLCSHSDTRWPIHLFRRQRQKFIPFSCFIHKENSRIFHFYEIHLLQSERNVGDSGARESLPHRAKNAISINGTRNKVKSTFYSSFTAPPYRIHSFLFHFSSSRYLFLNHGKL
jgi:hypothetical protein